MLSSSTPVKIRRCRTPCPLNRKLHKVPLPQTIHTRTMAAAAEDCKYENKADFNLGPTTGDPVGRGHCKSSTNPPADSAHMGPATRANSRTERPAAVDQHICTDRWIRLADGSYSGPVNMQLLATTNSAYCGSAHNLSALHAALVQPTAPY